MASIATVLACGALASETPRALAAEIAVRRNCKGGRLEFMCLGAAFDIANGLENSLNLHLEGG